MSATPMDDAAIASALSALHGWQRVGSEIVRSFTCGSFNGSIAFVNAIAVAANAADHHPNLAISWSTVSVTLSSHDANGLTERDFALARTIDRLAAGMTGTRPD
jgi:4a-hydroxytetrahydrobiopterin dehydratase